MSVLLGAQYSDSSSSSDDEAAPTTAPRAVSKRSGIALPSVDDVFATTQRPTFLDKPVAATSNVFDVEEKLVAGNDDDADDDNDDDAAAPLLNQPTSPKGRIINSIEEFPGLSSPTRSMPKKRTRGQPATAAKRKADDSSKPSGKDRVKAQRLKGQSGIGSDFRGWKSETEMQLRQQYD
ncbi:hypothetical protein SPRG_19063 [Saprolegnia parasitica CBS 223.65]|uniref:Uncharacterized protein n=1 Tax=Saprolegnia parasitica (strain CBS 223.65) TaxID=695850 RepID=A0A067CYB1_SAPPC|nr:hypothetical protein SPRG_19063 [Saprolegnia parasitica CBS 223.65]KDO34225.1 hypothetical protein SPRG_19063 [Saprolegnia parasitica CBS 223.65]|eukprot:XP_012195259.1 hypothetical protein SPRG_19063 [Saprolegnia parasitica CBS 223.65]